MRTLISTVLPHVFRCKCTNVSEHSIFPILIAITGFAVLLNVHHDTQVMYGMLFLVTCGTYSAMPIIVCWFTMNLGGHHRRAVGSGWIIGFGNIGGIIATYAFQTKDAVNFYRMGYSICEGFICLSAVSCIAYGAACWWQNRQRDTTTDVGIGEYEKTEMGDMSPDYRYML